MKTTKSIIIVLFVLATAQIASAYYCPATGRWLSRDPIGEPGFQTLQAASPQVIQQQSARWIDRDPIAAQQTANPYNFVKNNSVNVVDPLGLWATDVHHAIITDWLDATYDNYKWHCCKVPVRQLLMDGSDTVDGAGGHFLNFLSAQGSANAYQHAMRSPQQTVAQAQALYNQFMNGHIQAAKTLADQARHTSRGVCGDINQAVVELGMAYHSYSDSLSPSHSGFQIWYGPWDGYLTFGAAGYKDYVQTHEAGETMQKYQAMQSQVVGSVRGQFQGTLDEILK